MYASIVSHFFDDAHFSKYELDIDCDSWSRSALAENLSVADVIHRVDLQARLVVLSDLVEGYR